MFAATTSACSPASRAIFISGTAVTSPPDSSYYELLTMSRVVRPTGTLTRGGVVTDNTEDAGLAEVLVGLSHHVLHLFAEVGRANKLSQQQAEMICAVVVRGKIGMTELGRQLHLEKTNLSNLLERAEQRGLAIRSRDPNNRRITWVELTDPGTRLALQAHAEVTSRLDQLINQVPATDQRHLTGVVRQMMSAVSR